MFLCRPRCRCIRSDGLDRIDGDGPGAAATDDRPRDHADGQGCGNAPHDSGCFCVDRDADASDLMVWTGLMAMGPVLLQRMIDRAIMPTVKDAVTHHTIADVSVSTAMQMHPI